MSIRQTRLEYTGQRIRGPKLSVEAFMAKVKRLMARRMVSDGAVERKTSTVEWYFKVKFRLPTNATYQDIIQKNNEVCGFVKANTRSEARAEIKRVLGVKRLPAGIILFREVPNADSTRSTSAA
jgi:hypothetical protein